METSLSTQGWPRLAGASKNVLNHIVHWQPQWPITSSFFSVPNVYNTCELCNPQCTMQQCSICAVEHSQAIACICESEGQKLVYLEIMSNVIILPPQPLCYMHLPEL